MVGVRNDQCRHNVGDEMIRFLYGWYLIGIKRRENIFKGYKSVFGVTEVRVPKMIKSGYTPITRT